MRKRLRGEHNEAEVRRLLTMRMNGRVGESNKAHRVAKRIPNAMGDRRERAFSRRDGEAA